MPISGTDSPGLCRKMLMRFRRSAVSPELGQHHQRIGARDHYGSPLSAMASLRPGAERAPAVPGGGQRPPAILAGPPHALTLPIGAAGDSTLP